jgi:hypothetical protein
MEDCRWTLVMRRADSNPRELVQTRSRKATRSRDKKQETGEDIADPSPRYPLPADVSYMRGQSRMS